MDALGDLARSLPGYEVIETLGQGGYGIVYRARQLAVGREVALKLDGRQLVTDRDRRRFMREVTAAGRLSGHPHVVPVYDAGVLPDGRPYMVLELCPNGSLADRLRDKGPFPPAEVRDIGVSIADALAAAHGAGVLHRDVKPANILVNQYGGVALADFGLAVVPRPGMESSATREALTPAFASPEVFNLAEPTAAGDVYALASINRSDCMVGHAYETFAIAPLPADGQTWDEHTLEDHPVVRRVCSRDIMARSRYGAALKYPPDKWSIEVIPPSQAQYETQGLRTFRSVAALSGQQIRGSVFRPRS